jgi:ankyrin repeat protein
MEGDVLIIAFSQTKRVKLYYYHQEIEFKEVKNLPIVKNIVQLQPIIFQFIEDFLRSRIEIAFEKPGVIFNPDRLKGNIILAVDTFLPESLRKEVDEFFNWLVQTLRNNSFNKVIAEKTVKHKGTNKSEKINDILFADYKLSLTLFEALTPGNFKQETLEKSGAIDFQKSIFAQLIVSDIIQKAGNITKISKDNLYNEAFKLSDNILDSGQKNWQGELFIANKSYSYSLSLGKLKSVLLEKENNIINDKTQLQLLISYNDINNLFSLLNNRKLSTILFKEALDEAFGKESSNKMIQFLQLEEKINPKVSNPTPQKLNPSKGFNASDLFEDDIPEKSAGLDILFEGKEKNHRLSPKSRPNRKWIVFASLLVLFLTAVFAIPALIAPPVHCNDSLLLEMIKGNTHQVKRMVLKCANCRNPEQQTITVNNHDYNSPIMLAIANGDLETLKFLHEKGEIPLEIQERNIKNRSLKGWSAPWTAVAFNQPAILAYLASKKVNMDTRQDTHGETPLIHAISLNNKYLVSELLDAGADPDFSDAKGSTPLLYTLALDLPDIAGLLLAKGATIPPYLSKEAFKSAVKSEEMKQVIKRSAPDIFSFLDAFQSNSPFRNNVNGSFINEEEKLVFTGSLFRMYPFNIPKDADYHFTCNLNIPSQEESGELGVIFSSNINDKWMLSIHSKGKWALRNNKTVIESGSITIHDQQMKIKIKKEKNQFAFEMDDRNILTTAIPETHGNYFGFQIENNYNRSPWMIQKYKLRTF